MPTILFFALLISFGAKATTYYVATNGSDSRTCTQATNIGTPMRTIHAGATCLQPGDILLVRGGTYDEEFNPGEIPSGTASNRVTIAAYPGESVTIRPGSGATRVFDFGSYDEYITLDGLSIDAVNVGYDAVKFDCNGSGCSANIFASHIRIQNGEIKNVPRSMAVLGGDFCELLNMKIHDNGQYGYYCPGSNNLVDGCDFYNNLGFAIHCFNQHGGCNNNTFRNNRFHDTQFLPNCGSRPGGCAAVGITITSGTGNVAYNNLIYNNLTEGASINWGGDGNAFYNNTCYNNGGVGIWLGNSDSPIARNNICFNNGNDQVVIDGSAYGSPVVSNNLEGINPLFVNAAGGDFHLQTGSPAIDAGVTLSSVFTTDFDGNARPAGSAWDIGAYEYNSGTPPPSLTDTLIAYKILSPISLDGKLTEAAWNKADTVKFKNTSKSDNQAIVYALWDPTNLYLAYSVIDPLLEAQNTNLWADDGVEFYLDTKHDKTAAMNSDDYSYVVNINDLASPANIQTKTIQGTGSYTMEIVIPWSVISTAPAGNKLLGLLLCNNDRDNGNSFQYDWEKLIQTGSYNRPNLWGNLLLSPLTVGGTTTGITETSLTDKISIYPNPAQDKLFINAGTAALEQIEISNLLGEKVLSLKTENQNSISVDVQNLPEGLYILSLYSDNGIFTKKINVIHK